MWAERTSDRPRAVPRSRAPGPGKGGVREGQPGKAYSNRSDLTQPGAAPQPATAPNTATMTPPRGYGSPSPAAPPVASPPSTPTAPVGQQTLPQGMQGTPPALDLTAPTTRPNEPVTAGVPSGPGPNTMSLPNLPSQDTLGLFLRELYRAQPSEAVRQLILQHDSGPSQAPQGPLPPAGPPTPPTPVLPSQPLAAPSKNPPATPPVGAEPPAQV